jgi:magnesium-transporting ATPase (P-type)
MNQYTSKSEIWEILYEVPFDSDRKRMTMFVKNKEDKNNVVFVLSKGADNMMLPRLIRNESVEKCAAGTI